MVEYSHFGGVFRRLCGISLGSVEFEKFFLIVIHRGLLLIDWLIWKGNRQTKSMPKKPRRIR